MAGEPLNRQQLASILYHKVPGLPHKKAHAFISSFIKIFKQAVKDSPRKGKFKIPGFGYISWCKGNFGGARFTFSTFYKKGSSRASFEDFIDIEKAKAPIWFSGINALKSKGVSK